jgi:hypothetical protein
VRVIQPGGGVVQEIDLPVLGERRAASGLRAGAVVRDEQAFDLSARVPSGPVRVEISVVGGEGRGRLGEPVVAGRPHQLEPPPPAEFEAVFGGGIGLEAHALEPAEPRGGAPLTVRLRWRSLRPLDRGYKVFVHVLDPAGQSVVAQRDAEPLDGRAPTTGWVQGEVLDDAYTMPLPAGLPPGAYPVEVGLYDEKTGERLLLASGESRVVLATAVRIR